MRFALVTLLLAVAFIASASGQAVSGSELKVLEGGEWVGNLTYLDYGSNKKTLIKSNLKVMPTGADGRAWVFEYVYPDEPKANGKSEARLSVDGRTFNDQAVIEKTRLADGALKIVATKEGTDNNKKALFRYTYLISLSKFSIVKEVTTEGSDAFFERNAYAWTR